MSMAATLHGCDRVRVSQLAVTISRANGLADDYEVALHSSDPDYALRLAEALVAAHHRRIGYAGVCAIVREPRGHWLTVEHPDMRRDPYQHIDDGYPPDPDSEVTA